MSDPLHSFELEQEIESLESLAKTLLQKLFKSRHNGTTRSVNSQLAIVCLRLEHAYHEHHHATRDDGSDNVICIEETLKLTARLMSKAKEIGILPYQAFAIVRWVSRLSQSDRAIIIATAKRVKRTGS